MISFQKNKTLFIIFLIIFVAAIIRIIGLGYSSMWQDEIASVRFSSLSLSKLFTIVGEVDNHPPLYYLLLHFWLYVSRSDFWIRLLSALFGVGVVIVTYFTGKQYVDNKFGIFTSLLVATQFWQVWASREARNFIVVSFFIILSTYFFLKILAEDKKRSTWIGYIISSTLSIYTFYYAFFMFVPQNLFLLIKCIQRKIKLRDWILSQLSIVVLYGLWIPFFLHQFFYVSADATYQQEESSVIDFVGNSFKSLMSIDPSSIERVLIRFPVGGASILYFLFFVIVCALSLIFFKRNLNSNKIGIWVFPAFILFPVFAINFLNFTSNLYTSDRYFSIFVPLFSFVTIGALQLFQKKYIVIGLMIPLLLFNTFRSSKLWFEKKEQWREAVASVESKMKPNDCVLMLASFTTKSYIHYAKKKIDVYGIPRDIPNITIENYSVLDTTHLAALDKMVMKYNRLWLILSHTTRGNLDRGEKLLFDWVNTRNYKILDFKEFKEIRIFLCDMNKEVSQ